jgi:hypothetical protein
MNRTVRILALVSTLLVSAAVLLGRMGIKTAGGFVPVADPTDLMFDSDGGSAAIWTEIAMVLLLAGLATALATIRCWIQNRSELGGFSRRATEIVPKA